MKEQEISTKNVKKKNSKKIIIVCLIVIAILVYFAYNIFSLIKQPTDVFIIEEGTLALEDTVSGYIIRNEHILTGQNYKNGIVQIKSEGEKVSKGDSIFRYYSTIEESLKNKIQELDAKIQEAMQGQTDLYSSDMKIIEKQIDEILKKINQTNEIQAIEEYRKNINDLTTKKAKIAGELSPSGSYIKGLIQQRNEYERQLNSGAEYIVADTSGIVSYKIDNLESILTPENIDKIDKEFLEGLNLKVGQIISTSNESGKIIDNFECYIVAILDSDKARQAKVDDKVTLRLSDANEVIAQIELVQKQEDDSVVIIFKITTGVEKLINYRKISIDVIWWSYTGLKVPNSSIVTEGEENYIVRNRAGYSDKILVKILRTNDKYSLIDNYTTTELETKGYSLEEIQSMKTITLHDEILLKPSK